MTITLQPHDEYVEHARPIRLPDIDGPEGRQLVADFSQLLNDRFGDLSTKWGGKEGGALLDQLRTSDGTLCYPILSKYFGAILFRHMTLQETVGSTTPTEEPVIANPTVCYNDREKVIAIRRSLATKARKGPAYSSNLLVVHTLEKRGVEGFSEIGMDADEFTRACRALLTAIPELPERFQEIWFLNRYITNGKRLYRLN